MKCMHCQGGMKRATAPFRVDRRGYHLQLDSIPAWICSQCGESYFEENEVETIQDMIKSVDSQVTRFAKTA